MICKKCKQEIDDKAVLCVHCGNKIKKPIFKKWWFWLIVVIFIVAIAAGGNTNNGGVESSETPTPVIEKNSPKISKSEFEALENGMTYEEAVAIIGGEGELTSQVNVAGYDTKLYMWEGEGSIGANANATFQNDSLTSKAQFGLK